MSLRNANKARRYITQTTLKSSITCSGIGLHSGKKISLTINPASANTGIIFIRSDIKGNPEIPARWDMVTETSLCTTIGRPDGISIATIEHLMAAFAGCKIDNAYVEVNGPEIPVMDGSSAPFVFLIECAGIKKQKAKRQYIEILKHVSLQKDNKFVGLSPSFETKINVEIDFDTKIIGQQNCSFTLTENSFKHQIAKARTFGFHHEIEYMWNNGLALGGSLDNAVVIKDDKVLNEEGLRYKDEFVRHKALDALGDLYLSGAPILGEFKGIRNGHHVNNLMLHSLFADSQAWQYTTKTVDEFKIVQPKAQPKTPKSFDSEIKVALPA